MVRTPPCATHRRDVAKRHADTPPRFAIIGYGKLGGKELGYASDLDVIFLYEERTLRIAAGGYAWLARKLSRRGITQRHPAGILTRPGFAPAPQWPIRPAGEHRLKPGASIRRARRLAVGTPGADLRPWAGDAALATP